MLFGLDAFENLLFPPSSAPPPGETHQQSMTESPDPEIAIRQLTPSQPRPPEPRPQQGGAIGALEAAPAVEQRGERWANDSAG
ncbi:hypothetical protein [Streptomyces carpinensis]|nr:hypothetical protein [Streptomyces carpinensis]